MWGRWHKLHGRILIVFLETGQKWSAQKLSVLFSFAPHFMQNTFSYFADSALLYYLSNRCVFVSGVRHEVKESSKWSPRQDREGQVCKACVKMERKATWKIIITHKHKSFSSIDMYFPAPGFIASLLWEQEPRRLFNIISSSQYIIPLQILVYLHTRLTFMDRDVEWKESTLESRKRRGLAAQSLCYSFVPSLFVNTWNRSARLKPRLEHLCQTRSDSYI